MQDGRDNYSEVMPAASGARALLAAAMLALIVLALTFFYLHQQRTSVAREQVRAAIATADNVRLAVAVYHSRTGAWPQDNAAAGLQSPSIVAGKYVAGVHIENGGIVITLGGQVESALQGKRVELAPYLDAAVVKWRCGSNDIKPRYLPTACR